VLDRKRVTRLLFLATGLLLAVYLARNWPRDQTVHYVLGPAASRVEELDARWAPGEPGDSAEWLRQVTFHYAAGKAPRIVTHEPRLPDGDYTVEIEIAAATPPARATVRRRVALSGGPLSIDLTEAVPR
jgi:hypothetical protein